MSSIGLDPTESADFADHVARTPGVTSDPWLTWKTLETPFTGIAQGAANISFLGEELATPVIKPIVQGLDEKFGTNGAAWLDEQQRLSREAILSHEISPQVYGQAGAIVHGAFSFGTEALAGAAIGAPVGAPVGGAAVLAGAAESFARYRKLIAEGTDPDTAAQLAGIEGIVAGASATIPLVGKTLADSALRGALLMPYMNAWQRGVTHQVLDQAGYHDMAQQYQMLDSQALLTDAAMGALFGGVGHVLHGTPPAEAYPTLTDAVLTDATARAREAAGPGIPADPYTRNAHAAAMEKAIDDVLSGRPVDVSSQIDADRAAFVADPHADAFRGQVADVARDIVGELPADTRPAVEVPAPSDVHIAQLPEERQAAMHRMYADAAERKPEFDNAVRAIAEQVKGEPVLAPLKGTMRAVEKIVAEYGGDPTQIRDLLRATVMVHDLADVKRAIAALYARYQDAPGTRPRNLLESPEESPLDGYRDFKTNVTVNGHVAEIQINVPAMLEAKEQMHGMYEEREHIARQAQPTEAQVARFMELSAQMRARYNEVWSGILEASARNSASVTGEPLRNTDVTGNGRGGLPGSNAIAEGSAPGLAGESTTGTPSTLKNVAPLGNEGSAVTPIAGTVTGAATEVKIGDEYVPAHWAIIPAAELEATIKGGENQKRDRTRSASEIQVAEMANKLDYKLLGESPVMDLGAPTLSADGRVVGGNGRVQAIKRAYEQGNGEAAYAEPLRADAQRYGLDPAAAKGVKDPVLVRILDAGVDVRKAAIASNEGGAMRMSALEQAQVDAERLPDTRLLSSNEAGNLNVPANRELIAQWVGEFPAGQRAALVDADGALSAEGLTRLRNAVLFKAYGESPTLTRLVESADPDIKNVGNALVRAAPVVAGARAGVAAGSLHNADIAPDLASAVERFAAAKAENRDVAEHASQGGLFGQELTPEAKKILGFIDKNARSSRAIADMLTGYYERLRSAGNPNEADMFGGGAPTKEGLLESTIGEQGKQTALEREAQSALFDNPAMQVPTSSGDIVPARDAIAAADQGIADAAKAQDMLDAAINCDRRTA